MEHDNGNALPSADVPHADCATFITTDDLQQGRGASTPDYTAESEHDNGDALPWADVCTDCCPRLEPGAARLRVQLSD